MNDWICVTVAVLAYVCIFSCGCYRKTKSATALVVLAIVASAAPLLTGERIILTVFYAAFAFALLVYFEHCYERRLRYFGRIANDITEIPQQCDMLLFFSGKISELLLQRRFHFYSPKVGRESLAVFARQDRMLEERQLNDAFCHALRFIHDNIAEKWVAPSRGHAVTLLVERINRNALLYLKAATVGNMADIRDAAKQNLRLLLALYYHDFYVKESASIQWESPHAFAALHQEFERSLAKFPIRLELA